MGEEFDRCLENYVRAPDKQRWQRKIDGYTWKPRHFFPLVEVILIREIKIFKFKFLQSVVLLDQLPAPHFIETPDM